MRFMKTSAVALTLAVAGLSSPISSPLTATDAVAAEKKVVKKTTVVKPNGNRVVEKKVVVRRSGVRVEGSRYYYGGRYYEQDEAIALGIIGFSTGALIGGALAQ